MEALIRTAPWVVAIAAVLFCLDRLCRRMEDRGWIYYRRGGGHATRAGAARSAGTKAPAIPCSSTGSRTPARIPAGPTVLD